MALDVGTHFGQERFQDASCGLLVQTMPGIGRTGAEGFLQKIDPNAGRATDVGQCLGNPGLTFDHFGKQGQADGDDLTILSQAGGDG